jgi:hypothetical protein
MNQRVGLAALSEINPLLYRKVLRRVLRDQRTIGKGFEEQSPNAEVALALRTAAVAFFCVLDQKLELLPHYLIGVGGRYYARPHNQSNLPARIGICRHDLRWTHCSTS